MSTSITPETRKEARRRLAAIERAYDVRILLAVESGSRGWGFPSADSDYDVRFIYLNRPTWYLAIDRHETRDVIETPVEGLWDVNGWDLHKALALFRKSNPPLLEWLQSPIVYVERYSAARQLRERLDSFYSPAACMHHYLKTARTHYQAYLRAEDASIKKYFYVLRPLLGCRWIEQGRGSVPMAFERLLEGTELDTPVVGAIEALLEEKRTSVERRTGPVVATLDAFVEAELARLADSPMPPPRPIPDAAPLNQIFYTALHEVWGVDVVGG